MTLLTVRIDGVSELSASAIERLLLMRLDVSISICLPFHALAEASSRIGNILTFPIIALLLYARQVHTAVSHLVGFRFETV
ncbi:hypothetical protein ACQZ6E_03640 [Agrobacterium vitis]|uniref:hypothetical protein n=1 Tax=Agrobacterium vitis TaxID=373 RepID=UPI0012E8CD4D|nr:hypothetical protein [Agrobacterium vitis]